MTTTTLANGAIVIETVEALCEYLCGSGKPAIGEVRDPATGEVAFTMHVCEDCMAEQAYSDWYKAEHGIRPRWMSREALIEAWWALPQSRC
jgi:hypothetical protein